MDTGLQETKELDFSASKKTLRGSSPVSPLLTKTLDVPPNLSEINPYESYNYHDLSTFCDETPDDQPDWTSVPDVESQEDREDIDSLNSAPLNTVSAFSSMHCASARDTDTKPLASVSSACYSVTKPAIVMYYEKRYTLHGANKKMTGHAILDTKDLRLFPTLIHLGAGLANLGNTCFLNAVLQCFTHTVPLIQHLWSYNHPRPCDRYNVGCCALCALRNHIEVSIASMGMVVSPWKLVDNLSYISSSFRRFQQEDAHEFLQCLLDRLDSCCTYSKRMDTALASEDENLVKQVFGGCLISKVRCCDCGHFSDTYEPLIDLSLEIENVGTLPRALESFTKVEKIEDTDMQFTCDKCKESVPIEKQFLLDQAPLVATFHFKRFKNDGSFVEKIDEYVEFPLELDLLPYTCGSQNTNEELKYDLYAVVVHTGLSSTSGHYYCFVRSAQEIWYMLDDSKVSRVGEDFVLSQEAYILFYAKKGTPWFSNFVEKEKSYLDQYVSNHSPMSVLDNRDHICRLSPAVTNSGCEVKKDRDEVVGISVESFNGYRNDGEGKGDPYRLPPGMCNSLTGTLAKIEKFSPSALKENNCNQEVSGFGSSINITSLMPPRSPSPEIYAEDPPAVSYSIPRDHLISEKQLPCKRKLDEDLKDSKRKHACMLLKNMPNDRRSKLLAAMTGSHNLSGKKSGKKELSSNRQNRSSSTIHKTNLNSFIRPVAAGGLR